MPIYEPLFSDNSYGYRPGRSAKDAIQKIKEYAEQGFTHAVALDLSKYFDTLNHEKLLNLLRKDVEDERVIQWIKRYLKSDVMEENEVKAQRPKFPKVLSEHTPLFSKDKGIYARLAELLWNCRYEEANR